MLQGKHSVALFFMNPFTLVVLAVTRVNHIYTKVITYTGPPSCHQKHKHTEIVHTYKYTPLSFSVGLQVNLNVSAFSRSDWLTLKSCNKFNALFFLKSILSVLNLNFNNAVTHLH